MTTGAFVRLETRCPISGSGGEADREIKQRVHEKNWHRGSWCPLVENRDEWGSRCRGGV
jgi:hypothetical protein